MTIRLFGLRLEKEKNLLSLYIVLFLVLPLMFLESCKKKAVGWQGTMRTENGVVIVENPAEPIYKNAALILMEELSFGGKDVVGESELLNVSSYDVDDAGNIYAIDMKALQIKSFDPQGRFIRKIGIRGQGPGEYDIPDLVRVTKDNELAVVDANGKVIHYSLDGRYLNEKRPLKLLGVIPLAMSDEGIVYGIQMTIDQTPRMDLIRLDPEKDSIETLSSVDKPDYLKMEIAALPTQFTCVVGEGNRTIWGLPDKYVFFIDNASGKRMKITRKAEPVRLTDSEKAEEEKYYEKSKNKGFKIIIPDEFPSYATFVSESEKIMVRTYEKSVNSFYFYDVYDKEGRYAAKIVLPVKIRRLLFKKDKLYAVIVDDEGYPIVKRYAVEWTLR